MTEIPPSYHYTVGNDGRMSTAYTLTDLEELKELLHQEAARNPSFSSVGLFQQASRPWEGITAQPEENTAMIDPQDKALAQSAVYEAEEALRRADLKQERAVQRRDAAVERLREARAAYNRLGWPAEPATGYVYLDPSQATADVIRGYVPPVTVTFTRRTMGRRYSYAAVGVGGRWYLTGNREHNGEAKTWTELLEFAGPYGRATLCVSQAAKYIGVGDGRR
ncbi:hypothetical protein PBI_MAHDIA_33 [Gordonia phage Mahdia]|uniref:Uncharacterized protein n=1 Tax=Gordonia phage Mahdia TaxID=2047873 RepID=A0A2H4P9X1_9CAUD|nr:hypothetical protein FDJ14_gp33 [Gordonia phage Mahdia]ATW59032.1 hypothetical protein PBI_MAHDIA_33 [Gordonia phage Mahdia]